MMGIVRRMMEVESIIHPNRRKMTINPKMMKMGGTGSVMTHWVIFLPVSYLLGITAGWGVAGAWLALPLYIVSYSALIYLKYRKGSWLLLQV